MRANEILNKPVTEAVGDWFTKQVIGRQQLDKAKVQKQNTPKIAKLLQQNLASQIAKLTKTDNVTDSAIDNIVTNMIKKSIRRNLDTGDVAEKMEKLKSAAKQNPNNIQNNAEILAALRDVVSTSLSAETDDESNPALVSKLQKIIRSNNMKGKEARKYVEAQAEKLALNKSQTEQLLIDVLTDKDDTSTSDATMSPGEYDDETTSTGINIGDLKLAIKQAILNNPELASRKKALPMVRDKLKQGGLTNQKQWLAVMRELASDPDMPWNANIPDVFTGELYAPNGIKPGEVAYAWANGKVSQWIIANKKTLEYKGNVNDPGEIAALRTLFRETNAMPIPLKFKQSGSQPSFYHIASQAVSQL